MDNDVHIAVHPITLWELMLLETSRIRLITWAFAILVYWTANEIVCVKYICSPRKNVFFSEMSVVSLSIFLLSLFPWNISVRIFYPELSLPSFWFNFTYLSHFLTYCDTKTNLGKNFWGGLSAQKCFVYDHYSSSVRTEREFTREACQVAPITKWSFKEPITSVLAWVEFVLSTTHTMSGIVFINRKNVRKCSRTV